MGLFRKKQPAKQPVRELPPPNWTAINLHWPKRPDIAGIVWRADGRHKMDVVGESHYTSELYALLRTYGDAGSDRYQEAKAPCVLVREPNNPHDPNAVAVQVGGYTVGHIPREEAPQVAWQLDLVGAHLAGVATLRGRLGGPVGVTVGIAL